MNDRALIELLADIERQIRGHLEIVSDLQRLRRLTLHTLASAGVTVDETPRPEPREDVWR